MKKMNFCIPGLMLVLFLFAASVKTNASTLQDSTSYHPIQGKIVDVRTGNPIIFANIYLAGTNIGTVSNSEGDFIVKIPFFIDNKTTS